MTTRDDLYQLVDELPESEIQAARRYLEYLRDLGDLMLKALLEAPDDDERETEEERVAVAEARKDLAAGRTVSSDAVWNEIS